MLGTVFVMLRGTRSIALCAVALAAVTVTAVPALHASEVASLPPSVQLVRTLAVEALQNSGSAELAQMASDITTAGEQATLLDVLSGTPTQPPTMAELLSIMDAENAAAPQVPETAQDASQDVVEPRLVRLIEARTASGLDEQKQEEPTLLPTVLPGVAAEQPEASATLDVEAVPSTEQTVQQLSVAKDDSLEIDPAVPTVTNDVGAPGRSSQTAPPVTVPLTPQQLADQENAKAYGSYMALASAVVEATGTMVEPLLIAAEWSQTTHQRRTAVFTALTFFGASYVGAATGPEEFDCSGLTLTAWGAAGVTLSHWSASQQTELSPTTAEQSRVGDLAFFEGGPTAGGTLNIGHVVVVLSPGLLVEASPSHGVWVASFDAKRDPVAWGSPAA